MGFYEYDRVRNKNATHNAAWNLLQNLKAEGLRHPAQIEEYLKTADPAQGRSDRNEIYLTVMSIVRRSTQDEETST